MDRDNISIQTVIGVIFVIAALAIVPAVISVLTESVDNQVTTKSLVEEASYIIYKDGDYTCAKNGTTGRIVERSLNDTQVLQNIAGSMVSTGIIYLLDDPETYQIDYTLTDTVQLPVGVSLHANRAGIMISHDGVGIEILSGNFSKSSTVSGITLYGNMSNVNTTGVYVNGNGNSVYIERLWCDEVANAIVVDGAAYLAEISNCRIMDCITGINFTSNGVAGNAANGAIVSSVDIFNCTNGIWIYKAEGVKITQCHIEYCDVGVVANGYRTKISDSNFISDSQILASDNTILNGNHFSYSTVNCTTRATITSNYFEVAAGRAAIILSSISATPAIISDNRAFLPTSINSSFVKCIVYNSINAGTITGNAITGGNPVMDVWGDSNCVSSNTFKSYITGIKNRGYYNTYSSNVLTANTGGTDFISTFGSSYLYNNRLTGTYKVNITGGTVHGSDNVGYLLENGGTATILSGATSIVVNHGMSVTPTYVVVTGTTSDTSACWITLINSTSFTINAAGAVGGNRVVYWAAS